MLQALLLPVVLAITSPFVLQMKANMDQSAIHQENYLKNQLKMAELSQALLDESVCTLNLIGKSAEQSQSVNGFYYLNSAKSALDSAKRIMAPKYLDPEKTQSNPAYDSIGVQMIRLVPPPDLAGTVAGDALVAYLEIEIEDPQVRIRSLPIYFEYDSSRRVSRCSARRRVKPCT